MIDWKSVSGFIFSDCTNKIWRIFPKDFLFDLPNPQLILLPPPPITVTSLLCIDKGLWELPLSSAWMRTLLTVTVTLQLCKHITEHHSTRNSTFKTSLSWDPKMKTIAAWSLRSQKTSAKLGCEMDQSGVPKTSAWVKASSPPSSQGCTSFANHPWEPTLDSGDSNSCWEAAGDVAAPASPNLQNAASGCPVAPWISPWSLQGCA